MDNEFDPEVGMEFDYSDLVADKVIGRLMGDIGLILPPDILNRNARTGFQVSNNVELNKPIIQFPP